MENMAMFRGWYGAIYPVDCGGPEWLVVVRFSEGWGELVLMDGDHVTRIGLSEGGWERLFAAWQQWRQERPSELEEPQPF